MDNSNDTSQPPDENTSPPVDASVAGDPPVPVPEPEPQATVPMSEAKVVVKPRFNKKLIVFFLGILLLLLLAGIVFYLQSSQNIVETVTEAKKEETVQFFLELESPTEESLAIDGEMLVKGKTLPGSTVVVYTVEDEEMLTSDNSGGFETTVALLPEEDVLKVVAFASDGQEKEVQVDINYETEE